MSDLDVSNLGDNDEVVPFSAPGFSPVIGMHGGEEEGMRFPFFGIIHGVGNAFGKFPKNVGDFVYNGDVLISSPVEVTFVGGQTYYVQNLPYDAAGPMPLRYKTPQEVVAAGGNIRQGVAAGADENNYRASESDNLIILFSPKKGWATGIDLVLQNGSETLVPAAWTLRKTAHWALNPQLKLTSAALQKSGKSLPYQRWKLSTKTQKYSSGNSTSVPVLQKIEKLNDESTVEAILAAFNPK